MSKLVPLVLLGFIAGTYAYRSGAASCTTPGHPGTFGQGHGGFVATFFEKTPGDPMMNQPVMNWIQGHKYQVEFQNMVPYKGFILGMSTGMALDSGVVGMHTFSPGDSPDLRPVHLSPCNGAITHTVNRTEETRMVDRFTWMAPPMEMEKVALVGVGVIDRPNYFKVFIKFPHVNETMPPMGNMTGPGGMPPMNNSEGMPPGHNPPMNNTGGMPPMNNSGDMPPPNNNNNPPPMDECMNITSCGQCSQESACRWCASSMKCELKAKPTQCKLFGCLKCGMDVMPNYLCNSESEVVGGKCQCKDPARKWCNMGVCQMKGGCGFMANALQPCAGGTERAGGAPITQAANCVCKQSGFGQNATCHTNPPCSLDGAAAFSAFVGDQNNATLPVPSGSSLALSSNLDLGTTRLAFGSGAGDESGAMTSSGGVNTVKSKGVDFDVDVFEAIDIILEVVEATFKRIMTWGGGPRCKIGGSARFEADVTFSGTGGNFEIEPSAAVVTDPGTRVIFGTSFDLKMGGSFTAGGPLEFGSPEEVTVVKIDGTLNSPASEEINLSNDADIQISGTIGAADPANPPIIRGYGCKFQGTTGAVVEGIVEFYPKATVASSHRRHAVAQVEDPSGYSNTLGGATVHNAFIDAMDTWVNPAVGFAVNAGMRLHKDSALYFGDAFDLSLANFGTSWNGISATGTVTLDNCVVVLDLGNSATTGDFPTSDPFVLLEADAIVGTAFITVAADEAMGASTMWSAKIVQNGARWQLQAHRHAAATWADGATNIRSKLWGVYIDGASWPTLDATNFASTLDTALTAVWQKNAAAWQAAGFYSTDVAKIDTTDAAFPMVVFSFHAPAATVEYINEVLINLFRYDGVNTFYAASALKAASAEFQCATSDNPTPSAPVYACHPDYFTAHGPCTAQTLNDDSCGAARKENCFVKPEDSPHCFLVE